MLLRTLVLMKMTAVIVKGELSKKVTVKLQFASESAIAMIQKAGGTFTKTDQVKRTKQEKETK